MSRAFMVWLTIACLPICATVAQEVRIKDIVEIEGQRHNTVYGYGLVTGLNGTGGDSPITREAAAHLLQRLGQRLSPDIREVIRNDTKQKTDNISLVTLSAQLPANARPGQSLDVYVAALDDAESLAGGFLNLSPLIGVDGEVYGTASGWISNNAFDFGGEAASIKKNHPTSGRVPDGLTVEKPVPVFKTDPLYANLLLRRPDHETAIRIVEAINAHKEGAAYPVNPGTIQLNTPPDPRDRFYFLAEIQQLRVVPDRIARIVINERTGTVVIGDNVRISGVSITHANLSVMTAETPLVSQPYPRSRGRTTVVPRTEIDVVEEQGQLFVIENTTTVRDLAEALNALGVTPRDLSSVFQMMAKEGALHARLEFE